MNDKIEKIEKYALKNNVPIMQKDGINFLIDYIKNNNIKSVLEIGTAIGYSSIRMASISNDIYVTTIERDEMRYKQALKNINELGLSNRITIINNDALNTELNEKYDLIFIDAAKSQYIKFFNKYSKNLNNNGVIVSDNLSFHGMVEDESKTNNRNTKQLIRKIKKYIEFLKNNTDFNTEFYRIGDGISISKKY